MTPEEFRERVDWVKVREGVLQQQRECESRGLEVVQTARAVSRPLRIQEREAVAALHVNVMVADQMVALIDRELLAR